MNKDGKVWSCKIGFADKETLGDCADHPMRDAIRDAFRALTGKKADFLFSGWGAHLEEKELAVVEDRDPDPELAQMFYALKSPKGSFSYTTLSKRPEDVWAKAAQLVAICGREQVVTDAFKAETEAAGYSVVPVELNELRD